MIEKTRCHPSTILQRLIPVIVLFVIMAVSMNKGVPQSYYLLLAIPVAAVYLTFRWMKTYVGFTDTEVTVERNTVFKMGKRIPYNKIASVNVNRSVVDHIFGTSTLMFNINSAKNSATPEAILTFKTDKANRIRDMLSEHMYGNERFTPDIDVPMTSQIDVNTTDVVLHGLFSQPTGSMVWGLLFLAYSVIQTVMSMSTGYTGESALVSMLMFVFLTIMPMVMLIIRYYGFKVYRVENTIYLQHGLISTFRTSFNVSKINAVRVRNTAISRLLGRSYIEAEVVGLGSSDNGNMRPTLCVLKKNSEIQALVGQLVPEFIYDMDPIPQPSSAKKLYAIKTIAWTAILAVLFGSVYVHGVPFAVSVAGTAPEFTMWFYLLLVGLWAVTELLLVYWALNVHKVRYMDLGESLFTFAIGVLDRQVVTVKYDKVQTMEVVRGPLARRFGLSVGSVSVLTAIGGTQVVSGNFTPEDLERISEIVMDRINTGKYDYSQSS